MVPAGEVFGDPGLTWFYHQEVVVFRAVYSEDDERSDEVHD
jgi:hypothetical protein